MHRLLISAVSRLSRLLSLVSLALLSTGFTAGVAHAQGTPPAGYSYACPEGSRCVIGPYARDVAYGAGPDQVTRRLAMTGTFVCNNDTFGDPARKKSKFCYISNQESRRVGCAEDGQQCTVSGTQTVAYGVDGRYVFAQKSGSFTCNPAAFGNQDPYRGRHKACFIGAPY